MRNRETCQKEGRAFLDELIAYDMSVGGPKWRTAATEQTRFWCKSRRYAEHISSDGSHRRTGWIITPLGRRKIVENLPL